MLGKIVAAYVIVGSCHCNITAVCAKISFLTCPNNLLTKMHELP